MKRFATILIAGCAAAVVATGCSSTIINAGGDTTCKDFNAADEKKQDDAVTKMLKDAKGIDPTGLEVSGTRIAVLAYCKTLGTADTKISEAPHA